MNLWNYRSVGLTLSAVGREALTEYFDGAYADVVVQDTDSMGLWVLYGPERIDSVTLVLIRWEYIQTAIQDVAAIAPPPDPDKKSNLLGSKFS